MTTSAGRSSAARRASTDRRPRGRPGRACTSGGDWPEFDLAEWLALRSGHAGGGQRLGDWLGPVDVHLDRARVVGFEFLDVTAGLRPAGGGWRIEVSGPMAEGLVTIPADLAGGDPIELKMQRLRLESPPQSGARGAARGNRSARPAGDRRARTGFRLAGTPLRAARGRPAQGSARPAVREPRDRVRRLHAAGERRLVRGRRRLAHPAHARVREQGPRRGLARARLPRRRGGRARPPQRRR